MSYIATFTGLRFDAANPVQTTICIEDIAHALALTNRFAGHSPRPYSVAQHCYLASKMAPDGLELQALMHDAHEAYVGDMPRPWKVLLPDYRELERKVELAVHAWARLPAEFDPRIKEVDMRMLTTEAKAFGMAWWSLPPWDKFPPFAELQHMEPWPWAKAEQRFLNRFRMLGG